MLISLRVVSVAVLHISLTHTKLNGTQPTALDIRMCMVNKNCVCQICPVSYCSHLCTPTYPRNKITTYT